MELPTDLKELQKVHVNERCEPYERRTPQNRFHPRNEFLVRLILTCSRNLSDFAKKIKMSRVYLSYIVNGLVRPRPEDKIAIAKGLSELLKTHIDTMVVFDENFGKPEKATKEKKALLSVTR